MKAGNILRVVRPTDNLEQAAGMYRQGLNYEILAAYTDHDGFDGYILGHPNQPYHLAFTAKRGHKAGKAPNEDSLLVFYLPDKGEWSETCAQLLEAGFEEVDSFNPYWSQNGRTFEDVDGYRVVLQNVAWEL